MKNKNTDSFVEKASHILNDKGLYNDNDKKMDPQQNIRLLLITNEEGKWSLK